ncbi:kinesin-like protein KIN-10B [Diospyros lotus]|uniref:kinesin-like protein KIN-10B n=1 Tax=Diospyros lotus TaxID=55363 RepID=UPI00225C2CE5|nr:kinesin-like protein KIN-10B [Diospyros lotus]
MSTPAKPSQSNPGSISKVRVIVRVRPFLLHEVASRNGNSTPCVTVPESELLQTGQDQEVSVHLKDHETSRNECYKLDSFFGQEDNNLSKIFDREVSPLIPGIFRGCNATIFAYGATGSGKTYTMQGTDKIPGLIPLAMSKVLSLCQNTGSTAEISYYEVYMDRCYDIMEVKGQEIAVLEDKHGQVHLKGLSRVPVHSMSEFHEVFSCGNRRRKVAHTALNDVSSRSHAVLAITVSSPRGDGSGFVTGKLTLIDLAGNEDNRRTCNEGIRMQESAKINQSLFALSNVIYALNNNKLRVPYRESKLTRILQDSLGGTSLALMVACLNPGEYQESVHTVSLAARSRHISNFVSSAQKNKTPKLKVDMEAKLLAWLESKGKTKKTQRMAGTFGSPCFSTTPGSLSSAKKPSACLSCGKMNSNTNEGASNMKERVLARNLFTNGGPVDKSMKAAEVATGDKEEASLNNVEVPVEVPVLEAELESRMCTPEKTKSLQNPPRTALSPINSNISLEKSQKLGTPLDKFNALSSNLKSSLVREYIDFLNSASRAELMELKGIGERMAEYILELRESSPLKSLSDLEKIGLSAKQVHNMFGRTARGLFL